MAKSPKKLHIRTYHVGFGDCFLLSFEYDGGDEKHILIDFGSTGLPDETPKTRMMDIAKDIKARCGGKLTAVVATHRHKDHISGFATKTGGKGTGDVIKSLNPDLVIQPWTEDPDLATTAKGPADNTDNKQFAAALRSMHEVAAQTLAQTKRTRYFSRDLRQQFHFLGENNLANLSAVKNLMKMGKKTNYVHYGKDAGLKTLLPGVTVDVLGPPTVRQSKEVEKQAHEHDEFWHFQAAAMQLVKPKGKKPALLFGRHVANAGPRFPVQARWLIHQARKARGEQLLQIVRALDKAMNNTSVILLFRAGNKSILFPGDAQIENWQFALSKEPDRKLLSAVNVYKVGHHGSLNATPKTLWKLFKNKSKEDKPSRLQSLMSTMEDMHGDEGRKTEVPRTTLVSALKTHSDHFSTLSLTGSDAFFRDTSITF